MIEHFICNSITNHLDEPHTQYGFRKCRSSITQIILTIRDLAKIVYDGQVDVILLEAERGVDRTWAEPVMSPQYLLIPNPNI